MKYLLVFLLCVLVTSLGCGNSPSEPDNTAPTASVLSGSVNFSLVQLSWTQCADDDFSMYRLYRSTSPDISQNPGTPIAEFTTKTDTTYNDSDVLQDQVYYYAIRTVDTGELSTWSNEIFAETPVEAVAGYWAGSTEQGKLIDFYVTTDKTVGQLSVLLDISGAPDISWSFTPYVSYGTNGTWTMSSEGEFGGAIHSIDISGTFTSSNLCGGWFVASSETYYGGYYIDATFSTYPQ